MNRLAVVILLSFTITLYAQEGGGLSFLKIGFDARNVALGDVGVASGNDVSAVAYNPANLIIQNKTQISFTHNSWMTDVASELLGAKFSLFGLNFGLQINSTAIKNIEIRERPGEAISTFNASYFTGGLVTGFDVTKNISAGIGVKYIYESLFTDDAWGFGFDFGARYSHIAKNFDLALSIQNIGSMNKLKETSTKLPSSISFGASYLIPLNTENFSVSGFASIRKYFNESTTHFNLAAEGSYKKTVHLRLGYQSGYEARSFSGGLGFSWKGFEIDYAFAPFGYDLGNSHVIGVKYTF